MNTLIFVNATIGFSEISFQVIIYCSSLFENCRNLHTDTHLCQATSLDTATYQKQWCDFIGNDTW